MDMGVRNPMNKEKLTPRKWFINKLKIFSSLLKNHPGAHIADTPLDHTKQFHHQLVLVQYYSFYPNIQF